MCFKCFIDGDHRGHKFSLRFSGGGVCDCGDPDGLKPSGFCKNHKGHCSLDPSVSQETIAYCRKALVNMLFVMVYYSTFKPGAGITRSLHADVLGGWGLIWAHLEKSFDKNQNVLILVLNTITDFDLVDQLMPRDKVQVLSSKIQDKLQSKSANLLGNLTVLFKEDEDGRPNTYRTGQY